MDVRLQAEDDLIIVKDGVGRELHELLILLGEQVDRAIDDKHNLVSLLAVSLDRLARCVDSCEEVNDELVAETHLARVEEVSEARNELTEELVDDVSLHLWCQLLVQSKLLNDQVVIVVEGIRDRFNDVTSKSWWHIVGLVTPLNTLHPQVQLINSRVEQIVE